MIQVQHDGDGKLFYIDDSNKLQWLVEVQTYEGDNVRDAINSLLSKISNENTEKRTKKTFCECEIPYFPTGDIKHCSKCNHPTVY